MTNHSILSPSKRHRWARCPGSIREEQKLRAIGAIEDRSSPAAIDGTHSHTLLETCINENLTDPLTHVGKILSDEDGEFVVDIERANRVKIAIDYIKEQMNILGNWAQVRAETRVSPEFITRRKDLDGTLDVQIIGSNFLEIIDFKDGMIPVSVEENLQLEQYAFGVLAEYAEDIEKQLRKKYPFEEIRLTIIQPKMILKGVSPISTWTVSINYLLDRVHDLIREAQATDDPNAPLIPGEVQCKYCPVACNALVNHAMKETGIMFQSLTTQTPNIVQQLENKNPAQMNDDQIRQIIEAAPLMRKFLENVEEEVLKRLKNGGTISGLKLVNGKGSRHWSLSDEEMADKFKKMGIPKSSMYITKFVSPAQAEKMKWTKKDGTEVSLSEKQLKLLKQEYITQLGGNLTVVPESDNRKAITNNVASLFGPVGITETLPEWLLLNKSE